MAQDKNTSDIGFMPVIFETAAEDLRQEREDNVKYEMLVPEVESKQSNKNTDDTFTSQKSVITSPQSTGNLKNSKSYENLDQQIFELITEKYKFTEFQKVYENIALSVIGMLKTARKTPIATKN